MKILLLGPEWRNNSIKQFLIDQGNSVEITAEPVVLEKLLTSGIEFIISSGYGPIIKRDVVKQFPKKIINLHATYLPYGKGIGTTFFAVFEGVPTGVSIHYIDETIDTGDIIVRKAVAYEPTHTLRTFYDFLLQETEKLFLEEWNNIVTGNSRPIVQSTLQIKVPYRSRVDSERFMDLLPLKWDTPLELIEQMGAEYYMSEQFWNTYENSFII